MKKWILTATAMLSITSPVLTHAQLPDIFAGTPQRIAGASTLAQLPPNTFLENLTFSRAGQLLVTSHADGKIYRLAGSELQPFAQIRGKIAGIAERPQGGFIVTGSDEAEKQAVFAINSKGETKLLVTIPQAQFLNGIEPLKGDTYLVADSYKGAIWKIDAKRATAQVWLTHPLLERADAQSPFPAANGVRVQGKTVWVSNTAKQLLVRIPLQADGSAGSPQMVREKVNIDDFGLMANGTIIAATHVYNSVVKLTPDGKTEIIATQDQGMTGSTSVALRKEPSTGKLSAYISTNGGMFLPPAGGVQPARLVRLDLIP
jgi:hypothetical protein